MDKIIPFGKYKGQPIQALANDKEYTNWLMGQDWFVTKYVDFKTIIINNFKDSYDTPEHNQLQGKFIDDEFCKKIIKAARPNLFQEKVIVTHWSFECGVNPISIKINKKTFEQAGIDVQLEYYIFYERAFVKENKEWVALSSKGPFYYEDWHPLKIEIKPSVGDDYPSVLRQMKASKSNLLWYL